METSEVATAIVAGYTAVVATAAARLAGLHRAGCCGALGAHAGRADQADDLARATIDTFLAADVDVVVTNAAGCGSA